MTGAKSRTLAATNRAAANPEPLANIRNRHLRSALAWDGMAERMERKEENRALLADR